VADRVTPADYEFLKDFLRDRLGHDLGDDKQYLVDSRLGTLIETVGLSGLAALFARLRQARDRGLEDSVLEAMVTCETSFFRGSLTFERLRQSVIPALLETRAADQRLSIWCAGCSTGQEPYSIAITLADHFPELRRWDVTILATDISEHALGQAREGCYSFTEVRRGLSDNDLRRHFQNHDGRWRIGPDARRPIAFRKLNLVEPVSFRAEFDLIFVRNVLIYFCQERKPEVFSMLRRAIKDDGYLVLGESETVLGLSDEFVVSPQDIEFYRPAAPVFEGA
jgi:chemotaxis protein methyltransferase CheR